MNGKFNKDLLDHVRQGSVELMPQWLHSLLRNDNPDSIDLEGKTLLHYAAESNNVSMTQHFIDNNYNVDIRDNRRNSPLLLAVIQGSYDTAKLLVEAGADIYLCSDDAAGILSNKPNYETEYPALRKFEEFVKVVIEQLKKDCKNDEQMLLKRMRDLGYSLFQVVSLKDAYLTRLMLKNGYSVDERNIEDNQTPLHEAVSLGDVEIVKVLLEFGAGVHALDRGGSSPLRHVIAKPRQTEEDPRQQEEEMRVEIMKILIQKGAMLASDKPIPYILQFGRLQFIKFLMENCIDINEPLYLYLLLANANSDVFGVILDTEVNMNAVYMGLPLLSRAIDSRSIEKVDLLLLHGADPNLVVDSQTPFTRAFIDLEENPESLLAIVRLLLQYGADAQYVYTDDNQEQKTVFDLGNSSGEVMESVIAHLALEEDCGVIITDLIGQKIASHDPYMQHFLECEIQIDEMKETMINGINVTLYKLLTESRLKIIGYARNLDFTGNFEEAMRDARWLDPYYSILLHKRVRKAMEDTNTVNEAIDVLKRIMPLCYRGYEVVFEKILDYLTIDDLKIFCQADA